MIIVLIVIFLMLLFSTALLFERSEFSLFELERRVSLGDKAAAKILKREELINDIAALRHLLSGLLLIVTALMSVIVFGWLIGVLVAIFLSIIYIPLSRLEILQIISKKLYKYIEKPIASFISKFPAVVRFLCGVAHSKLIANLKITSREELQYLIAESGKVLSSEEKQLIINSLSFADRTVRDVMVPRSMISTINKSEFLGPLNLNDLFTKSGHSHLPVIDSDIDHIIGILNVKSLLNLDIKQSSTAEQVMNKQVCYIRVDQSLEYALTAFLKSKTHLFIVINEFRETVGLLSIVDVIEELVGRALDDNGDNHDDIHNVALRNPKSNNRRTANRIDV